MSTDEITPGAIARVTLAVGRLRWNRERCYVRQVVEMHGQRVAVVVSMRRPSVVANVPINGRSITVLWPAEPLVPLSGGDCRG